MTDKEHQTGFVISDLHLFAERSDAGQYQAMIEGAARNSDYLVLNGDIFDFVWAKHGCTGQSVAHAVAWLDDLCRQNPDCTIHYIMGNHDGVADLGDALAMRAGIRNFRWSPTHFRIADALYLHGDLPLMGRNPFSRTLLTHLPQKPEAANILYSAAVDLRLHRGADLLLRKELCARQIHRTLEKYPHQDSKGVRDIYFGHTHVPFTDFEYKGRRYHNTGAAIKHVEHRMLEVRNDA